MAQFLHAYRLVQENIGPGLHRLVDFGRRFGGADDDNRRGIFDHIAAHVATEFQAAHVGQHQVEQDGGRPFLVEQADCADDIAADLGRVACAFQYQRQHFCHFGVVLNDQHQFAAAGFGLVV